MFFHEKTMKKTFLCHPLAGPLLYDECQNKRSPKMEKLIRISPAARDRRPNPTWKVRAGCTVPKNSRTPGCGVCMRKYAQNDCQKWWFLLFFCLFFGFWPRRRRGRGWVLGEKKIRHLYNSAWTPISGSIKHIKIEDRATSVSSRARVKSYAWPKKLCLSDQNG